MNILFPNLIVQRIYKHIKLNEGQTLLRQDIAEELNLSLPTVRKHIRWLEKRRLIKINGKKISLIEEDDAD